MCRPLVNNCVRASAPAALLLLGACERSGSPTAASNGDPAFVDVTDALGVDFRVRCPVEGDYFMPDSMGPGAALLDHDGDGDLDVYLVNGHRDREGKLAGANRLFRQEADGRFVDVTEQAGVGDEGYGMGVAVGDIDNDGDADLFVSNYGPDRLYRNNGDGTFSDATQATGIAGEGWSASAGFFDYDGDGFLDLFVTQYLDYDPARDGRDSAGRAEYASPSMFPGVPDLLYRNNGDGSFRDASEEAGISGTPGKGLGVLFADLDDDRRIDVYVANDGEPNFAWINDGAGRFENRATQMGLAVNGYGQPEAGMGIAGGDPDGDGDLDLFVTHLVRETNTLYEQDAPGLFRDATSVRGLGVASLDTTGFGTAYLDVELDGDLDLVCVNGRVLRGLPHPAARVSPHWLPYAEPNHLFLNDGSGHFSDGSSRGGDLCGQVEVSRGLACGDLDGDGDLDLLVANGNGNVRIYRNDCPRAGSWLTVRALDPRHARDAIGAVVTVVAAKLRWRRDITSAGSYLSSSPPLAHFGLGGLEALDEIRVTWPDGRTEVFDGGPANRSLELVRGDGTMVQAKR